MTAASINEVLDRWSKGDPQKQKIAEIISSMSNACREIGTRISKGPLPGGIRLSAPHGKLGSECAEADRQANQAIIDALQSAPVAALATNAHEEPIEIDPDADFLVVAYALDGSATIDTNAAMGAVFSILPRPNRHLPAKKEENFLQPGHAQHAAGFAIYGPRTTLMITLGAGTMVFTLDPESRQFCLTADNASIPAQGNEYAINASNYRYWDTAIQLYVDDCMKGADGHREVDFNMRWIGSPVAEIYRIFTRGGIYLYPADTREGYRQGRFRLIFEANPIAFIVEQAGGAASTGRVRILDLNPNELHQRVPFIVGSKGEVDYVVRLMTEPSTPAERLPLFGRRGLFRM